MLSFKRLDNIQMCVETIIREKIAGDLIETGVMRGGAVILMRAILRAYGVRDRTVSGLLTYFRVSHHSIYWSTLPMRMRTRIGIFGR